MNGTIQMTVEELNKLRPLDIVLDEKVRARFIQVYDTLWGEGSGLSAYEKESDYFNRILTDNEYLREKATRFSIFTSFIDLAVCGLSLEPGSRALCYLQGRNFCIGTDQSGKKIYEGRMTLTISGYGELVLRARCGQIKYADNPVLVYAEDEFHFTDRNGMKSVDYTCNLPHKSGHIVAAFLRITRTDGSVDYSVMYEEDWLRLKDFSAKNNRKYDSSTKQWTEEANGLYSSGANGGIDPGFLGAKLIKHAFKSYPKVRIGKQTQFESQVEEPTAPEEDFYGVTQAAPKQEAPAYGDPRDISAGVQVEPEDDGAF